jgi:hypothetical protein
MPVIRRHRSAAGRGSTSTRDKILGSFVIDLSPVFRISMAVEYACEGCGMWVAALSVSQPPAHGFCVQCAFLCEYIPDPGEMLAVRKALDVDRKDEAA